MPKRGVKILKNSVIKLGRVRLRVRDIDFSVDNAVSKKKPTIGDSDIIDLNDIEILERDRNQSEIKVLRKQKEQKDHNAEDKDGAGVNQKERENKVTTLSDEAACRICWGTDAEDAQGNQNDPDDINPLISPCKCTGTMGSIHLKCLRGWLETKRTKKENRGQVILKFKKLDCELCKVNFPYKITYNNQIVDIVEVEKPAKNFIVFESLSEESQKIFYVINTEEMKPILPGQV